VRIAFLPLGGGEIELLEPSQPDTGVARFLEKRGEGLHHICIEVPDIDAAMARLAAGEAEVIGAAPRLRPDGTRYAFVHPRSSHGVLLELYQKPHAGPAAG
jgi:methylmalonyl-CoA/ethylmalonyl-CoA epimerase